MVFLLWGGRGKGKTVIDLFRVQLLNNFSNVVVNCSARRECIFMCIHFYAKRLELSHVTDIAL